MIDLASLDFTERAHRINAHIGLGAAKVAHRWLQAKKHPWACPEREAKAKALYAELTGRTMASHYAALETAESIVIDMERKAA